MKIRETVRDFFESRVHENGPIALVILGAVVLFLAGFLLVINGIIDGTAAVAVATGWIGLGILMAGVAWAVTREFFGPERSLN